jgi:hypothetical protein
LNSYFGNSILITTAELKSLTRQSLAEMAREFDIPGRSSMTKDDLVAAIRKTQDSTRGKKASKKTSAETEKGSVEAESVSSDSGSKAGAKASRKPTPDAPATKPSGNRKRPKAESNPEATAPQSVRKSTRGLTTASPAKDESVRSVKSTAINGKQADLARQSSARATAPAKPAPATSAASKPSKAKKSPAAKPPTPPAPVSAKSRRIREEMRRRSQQAMQNKDLSTGILVAGASVRGSIGDGTAAPHKDRIVLVVRDSYWLQADWEITRATVERVRVAMNEKWHKAQPVLRLMTVGDANSNRAEQLVRDIPIHGGVNNWFIDVDNPPARFRVVIGYLAENERFYPLCRSNIVDTPKPDAVNRLDRHWRDIAEDYERIYSLSGGFEANSSADLKEVFEERLQRQMPNRSEDGPGSDTDAALDRHRSLPFEVDAELIIYGSTIPGATVLLSGEPVKLREDGTFTVRVALPDKRQVLPVIAQSRDSMRQRTTVIAVERNTKVMEAVDRDQNF